MLKSQRNEIFRAVERAKFNPAEFAWEAVPGELLGFDEAEVPKLVHRPSGFYLAIATHEGFTYGEEPRYGLVFEPGENIDLQKVRPIRWEYVPPAVEMWLSFVRHESEQPDLWAMLEEEHALTDVVLGTEENTDFTEVEQARIAETLDAILRQVTETHELTSEQARIIEASFDELKGAVSRVGRKDWLRMVAGVVLGVAIEAALPPEAAQGLLHLIGEGLRWLVEHTPTLPPPV